MLAVIIQERLVDIHMKHLLLVGQLRQHGIDRIHSVILRARFAGKNGEDENLRLRQAGA